MSKIALFRLILLFVVAGAPSLASAQPTFPRPAQLESAVEFWTRVYTEVDTRGGFIHDSERLEIIYETVADTPSDAARRRQVDRSVGRYRQILTKLGGGAREGLTDEERRVLDLFPEGTSNAELRAASGRLRFQLGQADRFKAGLIRSGIWRDYIYGVLEANGVPRELAALPHVESSFDPTAYSKAGAAGMWQFTRSTGLRYMRIDHIIDERRDPFMSTEAAARLLRDNYDVLGHWPLAITAYNHGVGGMRRAVAELGTTNMGVIAERYKGRTFGFASRNFYPAFLAAADVDANPEKYFGPVQPNAASDSIVTPLPSYVTAQTLSRALGIPVSQLRDLNPALTAMVWSGDKYVPRGFPLRVPGRLAERDPAGLLAAVPSAERFAAQLPDVEHRIARGETLSQIASRYRVSVSSLVEINGLRSSHLIRAGQVLRLPVPAGQAPTLLADASDAAVDGVYVVRRGDSVERIARSLGVDANLLLRENDIRNRNLIHVGQRLRVPGHEASTAPVLVAAIDDPEDRPEVVRTVASLDAAGDRPEVVRGAAPNVGPQAETLTAEVGPPLRDALLMGPSEGLRQAAPAALDGDIADELGEASLDSNALASHQADLAADPSDYSVSSGAITVQALETLGHYADWLEIRTQRLRDLNRLPFGQNVVLGQALTIDFSRVTPEEFERRRVAYHREHQEAFFSSHQIEDVEDHVVRRGESLWVLAQRTYNVPVWLLRQYNPDLDLDRVAPGTVVKFPRLRPLEGDDQVAS